jgi:hypothetical protein
MRESYKPAEQPLWVKAFWIVLAVAAIGIVTMMLAGGHGRWQHDPSASSTMSGENRSQ